MAREAHIIVTLKRRELLYFRGSCLLLFSSLRLGRWFAIGQHGSCFLISELSPEAETPKPWPNNFKRPLPYKPKEIPTH